MQIELITVVGGSERFAPNWSDRAWLVMSNAGSGSDGTSTARAGDVTCLRVVGNTTYTDSNSVTRNVPYEAIECHTTNAPLKMMLGAWHDTPDVGKFGRVQCSGNDHDVLVTGAAGPSPDTGEVAIAVTGQPHLDNATEDAAAPQTGLMAVVTELSANMPTSGTDNVQIYWRCL